MIDSVTDLLQERERATGHPFPVPPDIEPGFGQVAVEPSNKGLVVFARVREKQLFGACSALLLRC
jgi:hypothetical protein